jgi:hypothetical protein
MAWHPSSLVLLALCSAAGASGTTTNTEGTFVSLIGEAEVALVQLYDDFAGMRAGPGAVGDRLDSLDRYYALEWEHVLGTITGVPVIESGDSPQNERNFLLQRYCEGRNGNIKNAYCANINGARVVLARAHYTYAIQLMRSNSQDARTRGHLHFAKAVAMNPDDALVIADFAMSISPKGAGDLEEARMLLSHAVELRCVTLLFVVRLLSYSTPSISPIPFR